MDTINQRINVICVERYSGNYLRFAKAVNIPTSTVRLLCGIDSKGAQQSPKYDQLMSIYNATGVSMDWLMLGIGDMMRPSIHDKREEPAMVADSSPSQYGTTENLNNVPAHAHEDAHRIQITASDRELTLLRSQNATLSRDLSSVINQMQTLIDTNQRLTQHIINSSNTTGISTTD